MSGSEEDKTLDDFFAKKSKGKKSKSKSKAFTTSKDIADKKQKTKSKAEEKTETVTKDVSEVEEQWKDFDVPQETDYTGLRIQALQVNDDKEREEEGQALDDSNEGEFESKKEQATGPWAKSAPAPASVQVTSAEAEAMPKVGGRYFPGAFKEKFKKERSGVPPDLSSQAAFPSLSSGGVDSPKNRGDFEMVKRGMKSSGTGLETKPSLNIENRYGSLQS